MNDLYGISALRMRNFSDLVQEENPSNLGRTEVG